ncbi:ATP-grasp domain-containing protein [Caldinitratiruptor microaerophilus]|uniref:ATP-grasp domain-containing protein n=1 Tax=Caldinitratiruptor microaerophilus TaxID=671077 RepID=A0AA35CN84_9FIRM|nr:RimK family alpha-L-glutamate ligase [Caldinitratiruptor microaerophilus]BDG60461.1 hypothetical protein caldi_15510 [Caldinitratiruptor microaerophilus]
MARLAVLGRRASWHVAQIALACGRRGVECDVLPVQAIAAAVGDGGRSSGVRAGGTPLDAYDAVLVRALPAGSLEQVVFRMDALHRLARHGVRVVNHPAALERTVDKFYTSALLEEAGIPTPATRVVQGFAEAMEAFLAMGDVVLKPLFGSEGRGMVRLADPDTAYRVLRAWEGIGAVFYMQEFVPHGGRDVRALVVGGEVVAAIERRAEGWKTNVAAGGRAVPFALPAGWADLAVRAAAAVGAEHAGVDLLPAPGGRVLVHEVNGIPGWRGLQQATGVDVADVLVGHVLGRRRAV